MSIAVRLSDIVDALQMQFDEMPSFLDLETGRVVTVPLDLIRAAEDGAVGEDTDDKSESDPEWKLAKRVACMDHVKELPTKFDVHEWAIMEEFSESVESDKTRNDVLRAIHGSGAFRYFKDTIQRYGIEKDWYLFRDRAVRKIAIDWCEENGLQWEE